MSGRQWLDGPFVDLPSAGEALRHYAETVTKLGMGGRVKADRIPGHSQWAIYLHQEEEPDGCL